MGRRHEYTVLRRRQDDLRETLERRRPKMRQGVPTMLVQVYNGGSMPSSAGGNSGKFFDCHPATVSGTEVEGGTGTFAVDSSVSQPVLFIGSRLPIVGEYHIARFLDWLWVAESRNPCVTDDTHVCATCCGTQIPKTMHIEDGEGSHALVSAGSLSWIGAVTAGSQSVFTTSGLANCCPTPPITQNYVYGYTLQLFCTGSPSTWHWALTLIMPSDACSTGPKIGGSQTCSDPSQSMYGAANTNNNNGLYIFSGGWGSFTVTIPFTCDYSSLTFPGFPTTIPHTSPALAVIGGGGNLTVMP